MLLDFELKKLSVYLIIPVNFPVIGLALAISDARIWHLLAGFLQEHAFQCISAVYPTVSVENIFRNIFGMNAINRIANILSRRDNQREGNEHHHSDAVVQTEYWRVDLNVAYFD
jgi:hypothetical protein